MMVSSAGSTTLPVYVYGMMRLGVTPEVNAISTILLAVSIVFVAAALLRRTTQQLARTITKTDQRRMTMTDGRKDFLATCLAAAMLAAVATSALADAGELHIYNWTDYTSDEMIKKFEKETGIKVTIDTYDSNETALAKLSSGAAGYDVMIISNDFVPIFVKQKPVPGGRRGRACPTSRMSIRNGSNRPWDPDAKYTVPWVWGTTSYSVDTAVYKGPTDSLKPLFDPPAELKGKVGMFGSPTEVMSLALVYLGKDQCNSNPDDLKALNALLEAQKPFVKVYNSDGIVERQVPGETVMHEQWSGKALATRQQKPTVKYVYPKEGVVGWMDNVAVPTSAPQSRQCQDVPQLPDGSGEHRAAAEIDRLPERHRRLEQVPVAGRWRLAGIQSAGRSQDHLRAVLRREGDARL